jgi:DNA excision repair protein ERCC-2
MANDIYYAVLSKNDVAIEGAAGMGKTVTTLSAILPICKENDLTLLYAARTHTQMRRVIEELNIIQKKKGHALTAISLHGRGKMCLNPRVHELAPVEAMESCNLMRKEHQCEWYENLISKDIAEANGCFTAEYLHQFSREAAVCPYYLGKRLMPLCEVVTLTYMYLVSPFIRSVLFRNLDRDIQDCIIVFDECHNLPQVAMNAMSIHISDRGVDRAIKEYHRYDAQGRYATILAFLQYFRSYLETVREEYKDAKEDLEIGLDKQGIITHLKGFVLENAKDLFLFCGTMKQFGLQIKRMRLRAKQQPYSAIGHLAQFLDHFLTTFNEPQYLHYLTLSKVHLQYHIRCIDCRAPLWPLKRAWSIVSISGTLEPVDAYIEICGFPKSTRRRVLPSPFDPRQVGVFCVRGLDITYFNRTPERYAQLTERCLEVVRGTPGNTAIFAASYEVLEGLLKTDLPDRVADLGRDLYAEHRKLSSTANDALVAKFKQDGRGGKKNVLLGVCGGRNSEGVDFPGLEMLSVVVVGVPLARMTHSINQLILYYTGQFGIYKGKDYAYTLPAMRRTNQAAGRPIRTLSDYGAIVLLDERYSHAYYRRFLSHWVNENLVFIKNKELELENAVGQFFDRIKL